jgi:hypothetical protein
MDRLRETQMEVIVALLASPVELKCLEPRSIVFEVWRLLQRRRLNIAGLGNSSPERTS